MADNTGPRYTFTIACSCEGYNLTVPIEVTPAKLPALLKRLKEIGIEPAPLASGKPKAPKVHVAYADDGTPICPTHRKPLREGEYGIYCSVKAKPGETANAKGYCGLRFTE